MSSGEINLKKDLYRPKDDLSVQCKYDFTDAYRDNILVVYRDDFAVVYRFEFPVIYRDAKSSL